MAKSEGCSHQFVLTAALVALRNRQIGPIPQKKRIGVGLRCTPVLGEAVMAYSGGCKPGHERCGHARAVGTTLLVRRLFPASFVAAVLLYLLHAPAVAAFWVRVSLDPATPVAGNSVHVTVFTFYLASNKCWDDSSASPIPNATWYGGGSTPENLNLEIALRGPADQELRIALVQRRDDGAYWDGDVVFPVSGVWTLFVHPSQQQWTWKTADIAGNRCAGTVRSIVVRGSGDLGVPRMASPREIASPGTRPLVILLTTGSVLLAIAVAAAILFWHRARGK